MNSVKISGLVLMGAFTLGITSGSIVSATAGTEAVSGMVGESQGDELTELNNNGKGSINDGGNSDAKIDASEDSNENKENVEGNLENRDNESSEKKKSGSMNAAKIAGYTAGGVGTVSALGTGAKLAYDKFAKAKQGEKDKSGSENEEKGQDQNTKQDNIDDTKPDQNGNDSTEREKNSGISRVYLIIVIPVVGIALIVTIVLLVKIFLHKFCFDNNTSKFLDSSLSRVNGIRFKSEFSD